MVGNSELRARARKQLGGQIFANNWLLMLLVCLIADVILGATSAFAIGVVICTGPLAYGLAKIQLALAREDKQPDIIQLFDALKGDIGGIILLGFLESLFIALWSILFVIPGIVKSYSYAMSFYIKNDDPSADWKTCIDKSREMMNGYKMKLFLLDLSFIGWYILGALCLGVGTLFVVPYHAQARANFYEELVAKKDAE